MMKKQITVMLLLLSTLHTIQAQKHDINWFFSSRDTVQSKQLYNLRFLEGKDTLIEVDSYISMTGTNGGYSDKDGNFLFYPDQLKLYNRDFEKMKNSDTLFNLYLGNKFLIFEGSFNWRNLLPWPDQEEKKVLGLFQHTISLDSLNGYFIERADLRSFTIDLEGDEGKGEVIEKNVFIQNNITISLAIRHGNGRDWWVITLHEFSDTYTIYLFAPEGLKYSHTYVDTVHHIQESYTNVSLVTSPMGDKIVRTYNPKAGVIFSFDRCNGQMMFKDTISFQDYGEDILGIAHPSISPNGRYLYARLGTKDPTPIPGWSSNNYMVQADLESENPEYEIFYQFEDKMHPMRHMTIAPDGKIYGLRTVGPPGMSYFKYPIIHRPDNHWSDCAFDVEGYNFPLPVNSYLPRYPNYRLGPLEVSPCDTLEPMSSTQDPILNESSFRIYPNPASSQFRLELDDYLDHAQDIRIHVTYPTGQLVYSGILPPFAYVHDISVDDWSPSLYIIQLVGSDGRVLGVEKLVVE